MGLRAREATCEWLRKRIVGLDGWTHFELKWLSRHVPGLLQELFCILRDATFGTQSSCFAGSRHRFGRNIMSDTRSLECACVATKRLLASCTCCRRSEEKGAVVEAFAHGISGSSRLQSSNRFQTQTH